MLKRCISKNWKYGDFTVTNQKYTDIDLPHDGAISKPRDKSLDDLNGYFQLVNGKYVKYLNFDEGKHYILDVDGAYNCAEVTLNEQLLFLHPHGYTPILVDLTDHAIPEIDNKLVITTNPLKYSTRWYHGSGIYRDVFMWEGGAIRIEPWDLFISTRNESTESAEVVIKYTVSSDIDARVAIKFELGRKDMAADTFDEVTVDVKASEKKEHEHIISLSNPALWDVDSPNLYTLTTKLYCDNELTDTSVNDFGIRSVYADAKVGLLFNGKPMKLRGGCIHHDHGVLGACAFPAAEERKIRKLKEAGFNAVRIAHNPPSLALLEVCDRIGMIVMDEAFDIWSKRKLAVTADYHIFFKEWWDRDISYMVKRDRNHPCVISYSIGNEIYEIDGTSEAYEWSRKLADEVRKYDNTRFVTSAIQKITLATFNPEAIDPESYRKYMINKNGNGNQSAINKITEKFEEPLDIIGFNYHHQHYDTFHAEYPDKVIWGSENWMVGFYDAWQHVINNSYNIGDFTWTAIDNLGEVGGGLGYWEREKATVNRNDYPWRSCYQGDLDLCGNRRPQSYFREAVWTGGDIPRIFVTHPEHFGEVYYGTNWHGQDVHESWTFDDKYVGRPIKVETYISADRVEWQINGRSVGESVPEKGIASLNTVYEKGEITAIAYRDGKEFSRYTLETTGKPAGINVVAESSEFNADRRDLCYFDITVVDNDGRLVAEAEEEISAVVHGGELLGIFSGNPCSDDQYTSPVCHTFKGKALAIVRTNKPGKVTVKILSDNLASGYAESVAK